MVESLDNSMTRVLYLWSGIHIRSTCVCNTINWPQQNGGTIQRLIPHIPHSLAKLAPSVLSHCTRSSHLLIPLCLSRRVYRQNSHHTMYGSSVVPNDMPQSVRGNCCSKNWVTFGRITKGFWCIITTVSLPHSPSHTYPPLSFSSSLPPSLSPFLSAFPTSFLPTS